MAGPVQPEQRRSPIVAPVAVGVLVALIAGGSAPWWWDRVFDPDRGPTTTTAVTTTTPIPSGPTTGPVTATTARPTTTTAAALDGCVVTIVNPLVTMFEQPDAFGPQVGRLPTGQHQVLEWRLVPFAGSDDRWFLVSAEGRTGWIMDSTILIDTKSADCP